MVRRHLLGWLALGGWLLAGPALGAELEARVDRNQLPMGEHLVLTLTLEGADIRLRAQGQDPNVDLTPLHQDFDVGVPKTQHRYNIHRDRGRSSSELTVKLFPKHPGNLTIPPFQVNGLKTQPVTVEAVEPKGEAPTVFTRAGLDKTSIWAGEQLLAYVDVYHRVPLQKAELGGGITTEPVRVELMPHRELSQTQRTETVAGLEYQVTRARWALFPDPEAELTIHLPAVWAVTESERRLRFPQRSVKATIKPLPADLPDGILVGQPEVQQHPPQDLTADRPVSTWHLTLRAPVPISALPDRLPELTAPAGLSLYPEPPRRHTETEGERLMAVGKYTVSLMASETGNYQLPDLRVPYFDPAAEELRQLRLDGPQLTARSGATQAPPATSAPAPPPLTPTEPAPTETSSVSPWQWISAGLGSLWLATLGLWWWQRRVPAPTPASPPAPARAPPLRSRQHRLQSQLLEAFNAPTLAQGLAAWERTHGEDTEIRAAVRAVQALCYSQHREPETPQLTAQVERAVARIQARQDQAAAEPDPWQPEAFASAVTPRREGTERTGR